MTSTKQFQYKTIQIPQKQFNDVINGWGRDGWEVLFMRDIPHIDSWGATTGYDIAAFMKREENMVQSECCCFIHNLMRMIRGKKKGC